LVFSTPGERDTQGNRLAGLGHPVSAQTASPFGLVVSDDGNNITITQKVLNLCVG
jgi:hypothetical protein